MGSHYLQTASFGYTVYSPIRAHFQKGRTPFFLDPLSWDQELSNGIWHAYIEENMTSTFQIRAHLCCVWAHCALIGEFTVNYCQGKFASKVRESQGILSGHVSGNPGAYRVHCCIFCGKIDRRIFFRRPIERILFRQHYEQNFFSHFAPSPSPRLLMQCRKLV